MTTRLFLALAVAVAVASCASRQKYPETWPALVRADAACQQFAGVYRATARDSERSGSLGQMLFSTDTPPSGEFVRLSLPAADRLRAHATTSEPDGPTILLGELPVVCRNGVLRAKVRAQWRGSGSEFGAAVWRNTGAVELHLASGALIVHHKERATGVALIFPLTHVSERWYRFERLS